MIQSPYSTQSQSSSPSPPSTGAAWKTATRSQRQIAGTYLDGCLASVIGPIRCPDLTPQSNCHRATVDVAFSDEIVFLHPPATAAVVFFAVNLKSITNSRKGCATETYTCAVTYCSRNLIPSNYSPFLST